MPKKFKIWSNSQVTSFAKQREILHKTSKFSHIRERYLSLAVVLKFQFVFDYANILLLSNRLPLAFNVNIRNICAR